MPVKGAGGESIVFREPSVAVQVRLYERTEGRRDWGEKPPSGHGHAAKIPNSWPGQWEMPKEHFPIRRILIFTEWVEYFNVIHH